MKYAVVKFSGIQYKVAPGDKLEVTGFWGEEGKEMHLGEVLLMAENDKVKIGKPSLKGVLVKAEILKQKQGEKVIISKFKAKTGYRRKRGFRPQKTLLLIKAIES